jgi:hypothetical protein
MFSPAATRDFYKRLPAFRHFTQVVLDCTPELAAEIEDYLKTEAAKGVVRYGVHRQDAAMMTCFTPSPMNPNHVHFIDDGRLCAGRDRAQGKQSERVTVSL